MAKDGLSFPHGKRLPMAYDLTSVVFIIEPRNLHGLHQAFLGHIAQKIFLEMLNHAGFTHLAQNLHDQNAALAYTVSDLFKHGSAHYLMRVTSLDPQMSATLLILAETLQGAEITFHDDETASNKVQIGMALTSHHEWAQKLTYAALTTSAWKPIRQLKFEFFTPTWIKSGGLYRPFPTPSLIFRLLYERIQRIEGIKLPYCPSPYVWDVFLENFVEMASYDLNCYQQPQKGGHIAVFKGHALYQVIGKNDDIHKHAQKWHRENDNPQLLDALEVIKNHKADLTSLLRMLARFCFFSGIGKGTAHGLGMAYLIND